MLYFNGTYRWVLTIINSLIIGGKFLLQFVVSSAKEDVYSSIPCSTFSLRNKNLIFYVFPLWEYVK